MIIKSCLKSFYYHLFKSNKMELGTAIVGIIVTLICIIPFVVLNIKKRNKERAILNVLNKLANENHSQITEYEIWNHSSIGIDDNSAYMFYICLINENQISNIVNLKEVEKAKVNSIYRSVNTDERTYNIIDKLELEFIHKNKNIPEKVFEFYNSNTNRLTLAGELQIAEKWCNKVNAILKK